MDCAPRPICQTFYRMLKTGGPHTTIPVDMTTTAFATATILPRLIPIGQGRAGSYRTSNQPAVLQCCVHRDDLQTECSIWRPET
jgi:hypothetical protein